MKIKFVEIQNFRKLKSVRIDFADETTLLVGANNSGKTAAMVALSYFLISPDKFSVNDFTLSCWPKIEELGKRILDPQNSIGVEEWMGLVPSMDIWFEATVAEAHRVAAIIPTLSWNGGLIGVRLRYQPKTEKDNTSQTLSLHKEFLQASEQAIRTLSQAKTQRANNNQGPADFKVELWPKSMHEFLSRTLKKHFSISCFPLDESKLIPPNSIGIANPQNVPAETMPIEGDPLKSIIKISEISAHRGFVDARNLPHKDGDFVKGKTLLSSQLRSYYRDHLDPSQMPDANDVEALEAIAQAERAYDQKLKEGFGAALTELSELGYPGMTDPEIAIATRLRPIDGLDHPSAVQYRLGRADKNFPSLPELYNGLGFQNLISMVFELMRFRDDWLQAGKKKLANNFEANLGDFIPPIHLVLIEEPEAHLHLQVQQVFIGKAWGVLSKGTKESSYLSTQVIVSTHSPHIMYEIEFKDIRYFRRLPSVLNNQVPISGVINLEKVFGSVNETARFVKRYIKSTHCELFFADAIIMVEGAAERILLPAFITHLESHDDTTEEFHLSQHYISILEIGGSHAHRFKGLIETIGLNTLIITDLDPKPEKPDSNGNQPETGNETLKSWVPCLAPVAQLTLLPPENLVLEYPEHYFNVRAAYQQQIKVRLEGREGNEFEFSPHTFEDALILENYSKFHDLSKKGSLQEVSSNTAFGQSPKLTGTVKAICNVIANSTDPASLHDELIQRIRKDGFKAKFALDMLLYFDPDELSPPKYIEDGLMWLQKAIYEVKKEINFNELGNK